MKLLFCHDGPMAMDNHGNAYPQTFTVEVLARYFQIADYITFLVRTKIIDPEKTKTSKVNEKKLNIVSCPNLSSLKGVFVGREKAKKLLSEEMKKCDIVIARLPSQIGNLAVDIASKLDKPYLIEVVACPWDSLWNYSLKGKIVAPYMYYATKKRVWNSKYSLYVTNEFLQNRYPTKGKHVSCSDVSLADFDEKILACRHTKIKSMTCSTNVVIGTTGAIDVKYKGQQYIIKALGKLKKEGLNKFQYQLVGGGNPALLKALAKKLDVEKEVKFLGAMPHEKIFEWLDSIDIYTQPSRTEGLPRALIEAMSRGLPAFGAGSGGIPELLEPEFIFCNTRNNIEEICQILKSFNKHIMAKQAKRNFEESKRYDKKIIDLRRREFLKEFSVSRNDPK